MWAFGLRHDFVLLQLPCIIVGYCLARKDIDQVDVILEEPTKDDDSEQDF